jgi:hypothetical protein
MRFGKAELRKVCREGAWASLCETRGGAGDRNRFLGCNPAKRFNYYCYFGYSGLAHSTSQTYPQPSHFLPVGSTDIV